MSSSLTKFPFSGIVFLQDTTGSQGPYIKSARQANRDKIAAASGISKDQIRFGLIAFCTRPLLFHKTIRIHLGYFGDAEESLESRYSWSEAQTAAMAAALDLDWAEGAIKMLVLIADSPPHGLGEAGDGFTKSPDRKLFLPEFSSC